MSCIPKIIIKKVLWKYWYSKIFVCFIKVKHQMYNKHRAKSSKGSKILHLAKHNRKICQQQQKTTQQIRATLAIWTSISLI